MLYRKRHNFIQYFLFLIKYFTSVFCVILSGIAYADVPSAAPKVSTYSPAAGSSQMASLIGGLVLIIALIYGLAWFVKRFSQGGFLQNSAIKVVASLQLGTRERLALVQVGDKQLLLGISSTQITCLHSFDDPVVQAEEKVSLVNSEFSQKLMNILQGKSLLEAKQHTELNASSEIPVRVDAKKRSTKKNVKE